jgi:hypothetical protein
MIIDIDSKEGSRIMVHQGTQENILNLKLKLCQKGWKNHINNESRIMPISCPLTPILV